MSASARLRPLIIGIGNPLRSDDGLGWAVVTQLAQDGDLDCDIHTVHQLTPELAQWMAMAEFVVMIDASLEGEPGEVRMRPVTFAERPGPVGTHYATPEELAVLTNVVYGQCPPVVVVTMAGVDFSLGEQLSEIVTRAMPAAREAVRQICAQAAIDSC